MNDFCMLIRVRLKLSLRAGEIGGTGELHASSKSQLFVRPKVADDVEGADRAHSLELLR